MKASNVSGCSGSLDSMKGGMKGGKGGYAPVEGTGQYTGLVKSYNDGKAWGFITYEGQDVFFHIKDCVDNMHPMAGDTVKFDMEESPVTPGTMKASNVTG